MSEDSAHRRKILLLVILAAVALAVASASVYRAVAPPRERVIGVDGGPGKSASPEPPPR